jgi:hypothetical protein
MADSNFLLLESLKDIEGDRLHIIGADDLSWQLSFEMARWRGL